MLNLNLLGLYFLLSQDGTIAIPIQILDSILIKDIPVIICGGINISRDENKLNKKSQQ